jgi:hypothetical protein
LADRQFDPSDMGFYTNNNFFEQEGTVHYNIFKPSKWYNQIQNYLQATYTSRYKPSTYQSFTVEAGPYVQFKNFWSAELNVFYHASGNDFYEARNGMLYRTPESYGFAVFINPNRAKAYNFGGNAGFSRYRLYNGERYKAYFFQNLRLNNRFSLGLDLDYIKNNNYVNWVVSNGDASIFSRYDRNTVENSMDGKYSFSNKMEINLRVRHYWSDRRNKEFFLLNTAGGLSGYTGAALKGTDRNYNVFNVDLIYTWQFAPGSELSVTYKNVAERNDSFYTRRYSRNLDDIITGPQNNSLSVKMLYYVDYLDLRKKRKN